MTRGAPAAGPGGAALAPPRRSRFGWLRIVLGGLLAATLLRACVLEAYRIPSDSMERTLLVGDFVLVSKLAYGPRIGTWRGPGLGSVACGDVVVFNHPPARGPVARRAPYIKRVVGLPGQTVEIRRKEVYVDGQLLELPRESLWLYTLAVDDGFSPRDSALVGRVQRAGPDRWVAAATPEQDLTDISGVVRAVPFVVSAGQGAAFPRARRWGVDDYGPLTVPRRGWTIPLTPETMADYRTVLEHHEGVAVDRYADGYRLDGVPADAYTFGQDYHFVLGDNRDDSADSRTWGFVPMSHVIGRAERVYFSRDVAEPLPGLTAGESGGVRWERVGLPVRSECGAASARP